MTTRTFIAALLIASPVAAQTSDPFPAPIEATEGVIRVDYREFAALPDIDSSAARMMTMVYEPGTQRYFVSDMRGPIYRISADGRTVAQYVDTNDPRWGHEVQSRGRERGIQSMAFHPQFAQQGTPGHGRFYTWVDVSNTTPAPDFAPTGDGDSHDTVLLEWTANTPSAATYDGGPPREVFRVQQPYSNHNGGHIAFNPLATAGSEDFGLLYIGNADGGSGGDPQNMAQNMGSAFGKILRIDPLGTNSANGKYGIPASNPFVSTPGALGEIYALGMRNPQRFGWDPANGNLYVADIGQNIVEELSPVPRGGNLGWNVWEGSFGYIGRGGGRGAARGGGRGERGRGGGRRGGVDTSNPRGDASMVFPIAEYDHSDPILSGRSASTGVIVVRSNTVPAFRNRILFGDNPTGEVFHVSADNVPQGMQDPIRRVLLNDGGQAKTLLELIQAKNTAQGKEPASRADLRFGEGPNGQVFLMNKADGVIRLLVQPAGGDR